MCGRPAVPNIKAIPKLIAEIKFEGNPDLIEIIGENIDSAFLEMVKTVSIAPDVIKRHHDMKIVYTPIHGTGITLIPRALKSWAL